MQRNRIKGGGVARSLPRWSPKQKPGGANNDMVPRAAAPDFARGTLVVCHDYSEQVAGARFIAPCFGAGVFGGQGAMMKIDELIGYRRRGPLRFDGARFIAPLHDARLFLQRS